MSFQDTLRKNLTPELFTQVVDMLGDDFDFDLVPRSRLNKVIKQRNDLRDQLAGISQPQGGKGSGKKGNNEGDDDDDLGDGAGSGVDIEELKRQLKSQSDRAIQDVKIQYAALEKLRAANVIDPELLWSSSAIDKTKLSLDEAGNLTGLDDMLKDLQKNKAHLFKQKDQDVPPGTGKDGGEGFEGVTTKDAFLKLDADKQIAFKKAHPEVFKTFMSAE